MKALINIEVCFALAEKQVIVELQLEAGSTVVDAIRASKIMAQFPHIDLSKNRVGVFGKLAKLEAPLREGDRVEIYRALTVDPKEARRKRAAEKTK
jgi:uncharacterized protein